MTAAAVMSAVSVADVGGADGALASSDVRSRV